MVALGAAENFAEWGPVGVGELKVMHPSMNILRNGREICKIFSFSPLPIGPGLRNIFTTPSATTKTFWTKLNLFYNSLSKFFELPEFKKKIGLKKNGVGGFYRQSLDIITTTRILNPISPGGGGGGGGKCPRRFQLSRTSLIFKQYLPNLATFTKIYWKTRFW